MLTPEQMRRAEQRIATYGHHRGRGGRLREALIIAGEIPAIPLPQILLATSNQAKVARICFLLEGVVECFTPKDLRIQEIDVEEGTDIAENARRKALAYSRATGFPVLGMDTGFVIEGEDLDSACIRRNALVGRDESTMTAEEIAFTMVGYYGAIALRHGGTVPAYSDDAFAVVYPDGHIREARGQRPVTLTAVPDSPLNIRMPLRSMYIVGPTGKRPSQQTEDDERIELAVNRAMLEEILGL